LTSHQNDGNLKDASSRARKEDSAYPYKWFKDAAYQSRGSVSGSLTLSDGRPAAGAAVFLGDNNPNETTLDMGRYHYYTTYADSKGKFKFENVRSDSYALQAWSNGAPIGDVSTTFLQNDITVIKNKEARLGKLKWKTQERKAIWRIGEMDRKSLGFQYGGAPYQHALVAKCPANLTVVPGPRAASEWCFGQSALGNWTVSFDLKAHQIPKDPKKSGAVLSVSLAGYSSGASSNILANDVIVGNLTSGTPKLTNDPSLYRSATTAGEWRYFEFPIGEGILKPGPNEVVFQLTRSTLWHGFMWDAVILEWSK
jgi:rhamnogalacturonan endolyase